MRIFTLLLIFICLSTSVRLHAQQTQIITLSVKNVPLETVLGQIKKQTGYSFFYDKEILRITGKVSVQAEKADLQTVLKLIFRKTSVSYAIEGNVIVLSNKKDAEGNVTTDSSFFSKGAVHGFVYDIRQEGLNGASVIIKRSHQGTITNNKGEFTLNNVRTNDTLSISFIGYATLNEPVWGRTDLAVVLKETKNELDQVVVQAYGTTTKRLAVGEITQVNAKDIEKQPFANPMLALESIVPGMLVTPTSGISSAPVKIEIRGRNLLDNNIPSDPLYVIDGVPLITLDVAGYSNYTGGSTGFVQSGGNGNILGQSPFFSLNPNDIESITVLKDAEATAMYGSRAGNGVIIITTKKGKAGETKLNVGLNKSVNMSIGNWDMLNTTQYLQMRREALRNAGLTSTVANAPDLTLWDTTRNVNWQKELLQTSKNTNIDASLYGGDKFMTFRISGSYSAIQDLAALSNENKNQRATISLNLNHTSLNQKLNIGFSASYSYTNTNQVTIGGSPLLAPDLPPILDKNGNLNYAPWDAAAIGSSYPFAGLFQPFLSSTYFLSGNINLNYQILKGLTFGTILGYNNVQANNSVTTTIASQDPITNPIGYNNIGNNGNIGININPEIAYSHIISKGKLGVTVGATLNNTTAKSQTTTGIGYTSDQLIKSIANAPFQLVNNAYSQNKYSDVHGRLNYNWEDKYIIEFTGNRDGSSSFGPGRQFGNFWSAGGNWIASEEKWLKKLLPSWISLIKFSGTIGTTGISGGDYQYLSQWSNSLGSGILSPYNGSVPLVPIHAVNQDYHWETDKQSNISVDLSLVNDRFNIHVVRYQKRVNDQLTQLPTPIFTGFNNVEGNSRADVQNTGTEISINANIISSKDFNWSANFNISHNDNKLLAFPGIQYTPYYTQDVIGKSLNTVYLLHYLGIDPQNGQRAYTDYNHDGQITGSSNGQPGTGIDDKYIAVDLSPKFYGGAGTSVRYKNLTVSLIFGFKDEMVKAAYANTPGQMSNVPLSVLNNHWQKPGDIVANPRFIAIPQQSDLNFLSSDGAYTDGSFIRLQNVNIAYSLPDKLAKKLGMQGLSVAITMANVYTLTKYNGVDPDAPFGSLPQPKIFNGKIEFTF